MKQANKNSGELTNYNASVGEAYHISKNGVLTVDVNDEHFRKELIRQVKLIQEKRNKKRSESKEETTA